MAIPTKDSEFRDFARNANTLVSAQPSRYGLSAVDATAIDTAVDDFEAKLTLATDPATRTKITIAAKDGAKAATTSLLRMYLAQVKANRGVSDDDKLALGIGLNDTTRTPKPAPTTPPQIQVAVQGSMCHNLRYADVTTPTKRAKPFGVIGMQLFVATGDDVPTGPSAAQFYAFVNQQNFQVTFPETAVGKTAYYYARWQDIRGRVGPWSILTAVLIA